MMYPSGRVKYPTHMMCEEDGLDFYGSWGTRLIVLAALPPGVKINNNKHYDSTIESKRYVKVWNWWWCIVTFDELCGDL